MSPSKVTSATEYLSSYSQEKSPVMACWSNTQLSILSMQIEIVLNLPLDFRKAQWKTWYMHPFLLAIHFLWKDDSYITASQIFEANTWQPSVFFFFFSFFHWAEEIRNPKDITELTLFPLLPVLPSVVILWRLSMTPKHTRHTLLLFSL